MIAPKIRPVHPKITGETQKRGRFLSPTWHRRYFLKCTNMPAEKIKNFLIKIKMQKFFIKLGDLGEHEKYRISQKRKGLGC